MWFDLIPGTNRCTGLHGAQWSEPKNRLICSNTELGTIKSSQCHWASRSPPPRDRNLVEWSSFSAAKLASELFASEVDVDKVFGGNGRRELNAENTKSFVDGFGGNRATGDFNGNLQIANARAARVHYNVHRFQTSVSRLKTRTCLACIARRNCNSNKPATSRSQVWRSNH